MRLCFLHQSIARSSLRGGWRGLVGLLLIYLLLVGLASCSTARERYQAKPVRSLLKYRDSEASKLLKRTHRSGNLYINFRSTLEVDAVLMDRQLRQLIVNRYAEKFLLSERQAKVLQVEQESAFDNSIEMLVFVYEGANNLTDLTRSDAPWRILLRDDEGSLHPPSQVLRLRKHHPQYQLLEHNFAVVDRWTQAYRIKFPKLAKGILAQKVGKQPMQLIFTGIKGSVILHWQDPSLFYRLDVPAPSA